MASTTKQDLTALVQRLEGMIGQFTELANLLLQERAAIKQRKTQELEAATRLVQIALDGIRDSDEQRQELTNRLARSVGLSPGGVSLAELDQGFGGGTGLLPLRDRLKQAIQHADMTNQENHAILEGVQKATEALLAIFKKSTQAGGSYNRLGGARAGTTLNLYSRKL